jgi:hypothetical protein
VLCVMRHYSNHENESGSSKIALRARLEFVTFIAGTPADPRPVNNEFCKRFARDLTCNLVVHFSRGVKKWVYDDGTFHTDHLLEFPENWIPKVALETPTRRRLQHG